MKSGSHLAAFLIAISISKSAFEPFSALAVDSVPPSTKPSGVTNVLGMRFVPVPGTKVLFSVWDTRVQDYSAFVAATGREWPARNFSIDPTTGKMFAEGPTHPAVDVSWEDAHLFCGWLTAKERNEGKLKPNEAYRLPTDTEWSVAVGLGKEEGDTPQEKRHGRIRGQYPWGQKWPPPRGIANLSSSLNVDDFPCTAPVGSFSSNQFGLFDMGGNVWQWCEDNYGPGQGRRMSRDASGVDKVEGVAHSVRVLRGSSWRTSEEDALESSYRDFLEPSCRFVDVGFRVVLADVLSR
jgi:formylglycine-generating enzyme required for sulfatase activity